MHKKKIRTGSVFQRTYRDRHGRLVKTVAWHLKYYVKGKVVQVASGTHDYDEAVAMLRKRMSAAYNVRNYSEIPQHVRMDQLFDLMMDNYRYMRRKSSEDTDKRVNRHLRPFFGAMKAQDVGTRARLQFVNLRLRQGAASATINKELSFVRRAMKLGEKHDPQLVERVPSFEMLPVDNVRGASLDTNTIGACVTPCRPTRASLWSLPITQVLAKVR